MSQLTRGVVLSAGLCLLAASAMAVELTTAARMPANDELTIETVLERFPSGEIKVERDVALDVDLNFVNHGAFKMYNEAGDVIAQGKFIGGLREGEWTRTFSGEESKLFSQAPFKRFEAPFTSSANFESGRLQGVWTITDAQGRKVSEIHFVDGQRHGKVAFYEPNGQAAREIDFQQGVIDGFDRSYNEDGVVVNEQVYIDGRRYVLHTDTYLSTKKKTEGYFLHPRMTVQTPDEWWSATLATFGQEEGEPIRHGAFQAWHVNGKLRTQGEYSYGKAVGEFIWWHANDQISIRGSYVDGKHNGQWQWWHENGMRAAKGQYESGARIGRWLQWEADGQLTKATDYGNGQTVAEGDPATGNNSARRSRGGQSR